jgi:hypothetical protein
MPLGQSRKSCAESSAAFVQPVSTMPVPKRLRHHNALRERLFEAVVPAGTTD